MLRNKLNHIEENHVFQSKNLQVLKSSNDGLWDFPYNTKNKKLAIIKIILKMIFQIFTGKFGKTSPAIWVIAVFSVISFYVA